MQGSPPYELPVEPGEMLPDLHDRRMTSSDPCSLDPYRPQYGTPPQCSLTHTRPQYLAGERSNIAQHKASIQHRAPYSRHRQLTCETLRGPAHYGWRVCSPGIPINATCRGPDLPRIAYSARSAQRKQEADMLKCWFGGGYSG